MDNVKSRQTLVVLIFFAVSNYAFVRDAFGAIELKLSQSPDQHVREQISLLEKELISSNSGQPKNQLKKIKRLMSLQKKEIELSKIRISELKKSLITLSEQKKELNLKIYRQKGEIRKKLREFNKIFEADVLDAAWFRPGMAESKKTVSALELQSIKNYYLSQLIKRDQKQIKDLNQDMASIVLLEIKVQSESDRLDYYVQELASESHLLAINESVQKEILKTNRTSRLDALKQMHQIKVSESEIQSKLKESGSDDLSFAAMQGKLPLPVSSQSLISGFGKSYDPKTKLLTFQKGVVMAVNQDRQIRAVYKGKVVFVGPLKNYGLITILEHPGQYYSLYGHLGETATSVGEILNAGSIVGKVNESSLYFEIRNKNVAINPLQWFLNRTIFEGRTSLTAAH